MQRDDIIPTEDKTKLIISRFWHHPEILVRVTNEKIGIELDIQDFFKIVVEEMGSPAMLFSQSALIEKLNKAMRAVEEKVKEASIHV